MEIGRRRFVTGAAIGTGAAWVAPQVLSVPAAAAATVPPVPQFVTCGGAHDVDGDDLTITLGVELVGVLPGDLLVAMTAHHTDANHIYHADTPLGWTGVDPFEVDSLDNGGQDPGVCTNVFTRIVAGGDTSYTFSLSPKPVASSAFTVLVVAFRGAGGLDPITAATATTQSGVSSITVGGLTPSIPGVLAVALIGSENPEQPWTEATDYTERCDYFPNNSVPEIYVATAELNTTSIPPATFTSAGSGHPDAAWLIALAPV